MDAKLLCRAVVVGLTSVLLSGCSVDALPPVSNNVEESGSVTFLSLATLPAGWKVGERSNGYLFGSCSGPALYKDMPPIEGKFFSKGNPNPGPTAMMSASQYRLDSQTLESIARRIANCNGEIDPAMTALMRLTGDGPVVSNVSEMSLGVPSAIPVRAFRIFAPGTTVDGASMFSVVYVALIEPPGVEASLVEFWTVSQGGEQQYLDEFVEVMSRVLSF